MEPDLEEGLMNILGQILARIEEMGRAQAKERRLFLKAVLDPLARRLNPVTLCPSELPSRRSCRAVGPPRSRSCRRRRPPSPRSHQVSTSEPSDLRTSEVQEPAELQTQGPGAGGAADNPRFPGPIGGRPTLVPRAPTPTPDPWGPSALSEARCRQRASLSPVFSTAACLCLYASRNK
ncbi:hypothetical protein EYF80_039695 [Liparis tanakae]|uniref:Uncharacterized protein n=1 Tax=Liparis tanakae TaxID=230148 RepID=A0A4Z2G997_9TELE|nr:hypothetical protein EYF80_039695 [Liparis tanakae]